MINEKRAFYAALAKARKEGLKEFEFHGKTFKVFESFMSFEEFVNEAARIGSSSWSSILRDLKYDGWDIKGDSAYKYYQGDDGDERKLELSNYGGDEVEWTIYDGRDKEINSGSFDAEGLSAGELDGEVWSNIEESSTPDKKAK